MRITAADKPPCTCVRVLLCSLGPILGTCKVSGPESVARARGGRYNMARRKQFETGRVQNMDRFGGIFGIVSEPFGV